MRSTPWKWTVRKISSELRLLLSSLRTATRSVLTSKGRQVRRSRPTGPRCACARTAGRGARMLRRQCTIAIGTKIPLVAFIRRPWPMRSAKNPARIRAFWPRAWMALGWPRPHDAISGRSGHGLCGQRNVSVLCCYLYLWCYLCVVSVYRTRYAVQLHRKK